MRRFFQYRLRTLLILMAVVAAPLGWWSWKVERKHQAVEALVKNGALILDEGGNEIGNRPGRFGHWRFQVSLVLLARQASDRDIEALRSLEGLEVVQLPSIDDDPEPLRAALPNCHIGPVRLPNRFGTFPRPKATSP